MKKVTKSVIAAAVLAATSTTAMAEVSMNVGATSNYIWRGVSQSNDIAAVSGGVDYSHESGFYAGAWLSSLGGADDVTPGTEFDYYLGFGGAFGEVSYDVNVTSITYPQIDDWNFTELGASATYSYFTLGLNSTVASDVPDVAGQGDMFMEGDMYVYLSVSYPLANDYSVGATYGSTSMMTVMVVMTWITPIINSPSPNLPVTSGTSLSPMTQTTWTMILAPTTRKMLAWSALAGASPSKRPPVSQLNAVRRVA